MEALFHTAPFTGYVYPNETIIPWGVLIVIYPYITGLVAGSFTVSTFYHVFGVQRFKSVARFALLTALAFMLFVPVPLLFHLGHPERALNAVLTPHLTSAMAMFGYFAGFYIIVLMLEVWFAFREDIITKARSTKGVARLFYRALTLGSYEISEKTRAYDHKWLKALAIIGIPSAHGLHGYVGFVFGSLKSREWWASDLMPVIFLGSAIISGIAILIVLYVLVSKIRKVAIDGDCLKGLTYMLWGFMIFTVVMEFLEFVNLVYKGREGIETVMQLVDGPLWFSMWIVQVGAGVLVPFAILTYMIARNTKGRNLVIGLTVSAVLVMISVLAMRWNVVIGGQELSKTMKGLVYYRMPIGGREGLLAAAAVFIAPLILLWFLASRLFPPWETNNTDKR
ncbi:MAG TPA: polysulfide reductase [Acidiferrobacteraceae bacterium]|nr:polysulfide reductase [Acidiferrobacteraceae bacterium]HEX19556.1 polysulfide reductase [Acidiferrobacteraceae bacterium]